MRRTLTALAAAAAFVGAIENPAYSATFAPIAQGKSLVMTGPVTDGDDERFRAAFRASYRKYGYAPERIFLNSDGGSVRAGLQVASLIEATGLHTVIGRTDECYSICAVIFGAGSHRVVFPTSVIGVHSAGTATNDANGNSAVEETLVSSAYTLALGRLMARYGAPDRVVVKLITTDADDLSYLTMADLAGWVELLD